MADLARNHPFIDGNKRVGFGVGVLFLELNVYLSPPTRRKRPKRCGRWRRARWMKPGPLASCGSTAGASRREPKANGESAAFYRCC